MLFSISEKCFTPLLVINYVHIWETLFYSQQVKILFQKKSYVSLLPTNYTRSSVLLSISETYFPRRNPISISLLSINCA